MMFIRRLQGIHPTRSSLGSTTLLVYFLWLVRFLNVFSLSVLAMTTSTNNNYSSVSLPRRHLPDKLLVSYTTQCSPKVIRAVRDGVNVVIWAFCEMQVTVTTEEDEESTDNNHNNRKVARCISRFDRECAKAMVAELDSEGFQDTIHLVSFGGWNGPHLPDELTADEMYRAWKESFGDIFHGVDFDLEGHDDLNSPTNVFSIQCLDNMGKFSQLAKQDGYIIGVAPPQSYLDLANSNFSRAVNRTDLTRSWHADFSYFGANVYAYLLAKYGNYIDFVSIQFYESYSRAAMEVFHKRQARRDYLYSYARDHAANKKEYFSVKFDQDPSLQYSSDDVYLPMTKLVFGFANGWAADDEGDKVCYFSPTEIGQAHEKLSFDGFTPRGMMFWVM